MSVLIKGMEMPDKKNGAILIFYPDGKVCYEDGTEFEAVELPPQRRARMRFRPCPFCGGKAEIWHGSARDGNICFDTLSVFCLDCGARTREIWVDDENKYRAERDVIEAWNRRAANDEL